MERLLRGLVNTGRPSMYGQREQRKENGGQTQQTCAHTNNQHGHTYGERKTRDLDCGTGRQKEHASPHGRSGRVRVTDRSPGGEWRSWVFFFALVIEEYKIIFFYDSSSEYFGQAEERRGEERVSCFHLISIPGSSSSTSSLGVRIIHH